MVGLILKVLAAICFIFLVFDVQIGDVELLPLGLFLWVLAEILPGAVGAYGRRSESSK